MEDKENTKSGKGEKFRLRLELRVKNAYLVEAREKLNLNAKEAAEKIGISKGYYRQCEKMAVYPALETQKRICDFYTGLGMPLIEEDVFPPELRHTRISTKYTMTKEIPRQFLISIDRVPPKQLSYTPNEEFDTPTLEEEIEQILSTLTPKEAEVISLYFGLGNDPERATLDEIGEIFSLSRERVRQIKENALRRLRHSSRSKILKDYLEE